MVNTTSFCHPMPAGYALPKGDLLLHERICSKRSKFFHIRVDPIEKVSNNENDRVFSPVPFTFFLKGKRSREETLSLSLKFLVVSPPAAVSLIVCLVFQICHSSFSVLGSVVVCLFWLFYTNRFRKILIEDRIDWRLWQLVYIPITVVIQSFDRFRRTFNRSYGIQ